MPASPLDSRLEFYRSLLADRDLQKLRELKRYRSTLLQLEAKDGQRYFAKHIEGESGPSDSPTDPRENLLNDFAALQFLKSRPALHDRVPEFITGDVAKGAFVMRDLGDGQQIDEILKGQDSLAAEQALIGLMETLARIHGETLGREADFMAVRKPMGSLRPKDGGVAESVGGYMDYVAEVCATLKIEVDTNALHTEIESLVREMLEPGPLHGLVHWDPCPDNAKVVDGQVKLYDFERAAFANVFVDGVYLDILFPSCWCVSQMPESTIEKGSAAYRRALSSYVPALTDDAFYERTQAMACAFWFLRSTDWEFTTVMKEDRKWGLCSIRQRFLSRVRIAERMLDSSRVLPNLREFLARYANRIEALWGTETLPMPHYPAFTS